MSDKKDRIKITSPKGVAKYPKLNTPDTKFNPLGVYSVKMVFAKDAVAPLIEQLKEVAAAALVEAKAKLEEALAEAKGEKKGKLKKELADLKPSDLPVKPAYDDDGNETSDVEITFKMNAVRKDKKDEKKLIPMRPRFFDSKGVAIPDERVPNIWGGSVLKCSAELSPFYTAKAGAGVSARLNAVQIIKLVTGSGMNAADHGFGAEDDEDGFNAEDAPEAAPQAPATAGSESGADEEF